ncbi:isopentenyl transferase family protein [Nocardia sp. XZ_19_231]|uniref:isopentenyl transferase family protein n=1 Tax=Nocardia sp. XZ_19_231 TaxID=2769252 RepID=UPI00188DF392
MSTTVDNDQRNTHSGSAMVDYFATRAAPKHTADLRPAPGRVSDSMSISTTPKSRVHAVVGATGTGTAERAKALAQQWDVPIVVGDPDQCYLDLATTTRSFLDGQSSVRRVFLEERTVSDGEFSADAAGRSLCYTLGQLAVEHPVIVVEISSAALLGAVFGEHEQLPFELSIELLSPPDFPAYMKRLTDRCRQMITPPPGRPSILAELSAAWRIGPQRKFLASIAGLGALIDWCELRGVSPDTLSEMALTEPIIQEMTIVMAFEHATTGDAQDQTLRTVLSSCECFAHAL